MKFFFIFMIILSSSSMALQQDEYNKIDRECFIITLDFLERSGIYPDNKNYSFFFMHKYNSCLRDKLYDIIEKRNKE